jgi:hypothetical protein
MSDKAEKPSAEERIDALSEILRAQPLSDERSVRLFEPCHPPTQEEIAAMPLASNA